MNAFSSEITTGMSAPPIGITIETPKMSAAAMTTPRPIMLGAAITYTPKPTAITASSRFTIRAPGKVTGAEVIMPCSFPAAMIDPENVTDPMITSSSVGTDVEAPTLAPIVMKSRMATSAAAPPPTALKMLTSCGMAVIFTVLAVYRPNPPPTRMPAAITIQPVVSIWPSWMTSAPVATMAATMPATET